MYYTLYYTILYIRFRYTHKINLWTLQSNATSGDANEEPLGDLSLLPLSQWSIDLRVHPWEALGNLRSSRGVMYARPHSPSFPQSWTYNVSSPLGTRSCWSDTLLIPDDRFLPARSTVLFSFLFFFLFLLFFFSTLSIIPIIPSLFQFSFSSTRTGMQDMPKSDGCLFPSHGKELWYA